MRLKDYIFALLLTLVVIFVLSSGITTRQNTITVNQNFETVQSDIRDLAAEVDRLRQEAVKWEELQPVIEDVEQYQTTVDKMTARYKDLDEILQAWFGDQQKAVMRSYERQK